ncbi:class I SAM-dependent methyltransferase [Agromyces bauzanensis]|uniref:Methyltransferase n=1 Tax=Agromyces bauzanensis TaxID=1308924 RepID=A0A917UPH9_9MICO|nr:class I SAM-dependent methyltransferase [Agromyces bauzanensis]GGJ72610.1 methyltransferase [Agromyces bauzanensis]
MGDTQTVPDFAEEFGRGAASFAELDEPLWNPISTAAVARSRPQFDEHVLDACCGDGASALPTAELVGVGGLVDAVDLAEPLIAIARERADDRMPQLHLHVADVTTWEPAGYDLVQCVLGILFLPDVAAGTRHLIERARPGGRVAVTVWARGALEPLPDLLVRALPDGAASDLDLEDLTKPTVESAETPGTLALWLTERGLVDVRAEQVQRRLEPTPELAWRLVRGTGLQAIVSGLDDGELERVRERFLATLAEDGVTSVDVSTLIAVGRRPEVE